MQINKECEKEIVTKPMSKTQEDWIEYFNSKGQKMISAPDIYKVAKEEHKELMESLKKDFIDSWIVTSTRIIYNENNLNAEIIHDVDSNIVKQTKTDVIIPVIWGEVKETPEVERFLQALFETKDNLSDIMKILKRFDSTRKLCLWLPNQSDRKQKQVRSVGLDFDYFGGFSVYGYWGGGYGGFSRGVTVSSAKQTKKTGDLQ